MAKNIKVIFHGTKAPSGKTTEIEYMISSVRKKLLEASGMYDMEVVGEPKAKPKKKSPSKKGGKK